MTHTALIVAAGRGVRLGSPLPKQYLPLAGVPILRRTVEAFLNHPGIDHVQVVIAGTDEQLYRMATAGLALPEPVIGGADRQQSVLNGLEALAGLNPDTVLIHDAARPFVEAQTISDVLDALHRADGALPVQALSDSIKTLSGSDVTGEEDRDRLGRAQTPQGFGFAAILQAHRKADPGSATDDVQIAVAGGLRVLAVSGDSENFKITTEADLEQARQMVSRSDSTGRDLRVGSGFDVHRYAPDRPMVLCGVTVPYHLGLAGHSDADVGLHAITDAVLGALAEGDIGDHFPPTDPQWRGAPSEVFLRFAAERVLARGGCITSVDVTLICEAPKIKPHRLAMRDAIAAMLEVDIERVSVKATTTEKLGFTGRGEGIAAQAVVALSLPTEA